MKSLLFTSLSVLFSCTDSAFYNVSTSHLSSNNKLVSDIACPVNNWQNFLQHLPISNSPIVDYQGNEISNQAKHAALINYDVGTTDLQQCADALIRLRAEYLYSQKRFFEIDFHFTSGDYYWWEDYCKSKRPVIRGNKVYFTNTYASDHTHTSLRKYLDIVYTYSGTISLNKELKTADSFDIGTIVIYPGSPGHCFIIIDKAKDKNGANAFKLAEEYTPAQSFIF